MGQAVATSVTEENDDLEDGDDQNDDPGTDDAVLASGFIDLKGLRQSVEDAKLCLEAHLSYYPVFVEMGEVEADLDKQIAAAQAKLGRRPGNARQRREDGGDRSASPAPRRGAARGDRSGDASAAAGETPQR